MAGDVPDFTAFDAQVLLLAQQVAAAIANIPGLLGDDGEEVDA